MPSYLEGLRLASLHALDCLAYGSAYTLLDLGIAYAFPDDVPDEAIPLWRARCCLAIALATVDHPEDFTDPLDVWLIKVKEVRRLLGAQIDNE